MTYTATMTMRLLIRNDGDADMTTQLEYFAKKLSELPMGALCPPDLHVVMTGGHITDVKERK